MQKFILIVSSAKFSIVHTQHRLRIFSIIKNNVIHDYFVICMCNLKNKTTTDCININVAEQASI